MPKKGYKQSEEHKEKTRQIHLGMKQSEETIHKRVSKTIGLKRNEEQRKKISEGLKNSETSKRTQFKRGAEHSRWKGGISKKIIANIRFKRSSEPMPLDLRKKISDSLKGRHCSPNTEFKKGDEALIKRQTELWGRPEYRLLAKERRSKLVLPLKDSSIEVRIQNFLRELKIDFFTHQYMKIEHGYQCDILIPSMNLVIECDGDYWHKYPIGKELDHVRTKELIEKGFKVLRLWEFEINEMSISQFNKKLNQEV